MNIIRSHFPEIKPFETECPMVTGWDSISESCATLLVDESRLSPGDVERVFLPRSTIEVSQVLKMCHENRWRVVVSGGRTGIVGGAVALDCDALISLERMSRITEFGDDFLRAEAGATLDEIFKFISKEKPSMFYPVDPTETTASIGGTVVTNASGARTYFYGPTRKWINAITVVLPDGSILKLRRGEIIAEDKTFIFEFPGQERKEFSFSRFEYPGVKNTTGYQLREGMDAIDLFIGSEGTLGIVAEVEIRLIPCPINRLYTVIWTQSERETIELVEMVKSSSVIKPLAIEYFDPNSILILKQKRCEQGEESLFPPIPLKAVAALFLDMIFEDETDLGNLSCEIEKIMSKLGLDLDDTWSGLEERDLERMKLLRHALPETINEIISKRKISNPELHKLSTDLAVPDGRLAKMLRIYHTRLSRDSLEYVIFGHIGDNHLHLNMLPRDSKELAKAKILYDEFAREAVRLGGTIAAEHGIGRLKRHLMKLQYSPEMLESMRELKRIFDPDEILNPGVLLPD